MRAQVKAYWQGFKQRVLGAGTPLEEDLYAAFLEEAHERKASYQEEFKEDVKGTLKISEHRLEGRLLCEHTLSVTLEYAEVADGRTLIDLRVLATLAKYNQSHCIDLELLEGLLKLNLEFTFEDLEIWKNLLIQGRYEEAVLLEYGVAAIHRSSHPHAVPSPRQSPQSTHSEVLSHSPNESSTQLLEEDESVAKESRANKYWKSLKRQRRAHLVPNPNRARQAQEEVQRTKQEEILRIPQPGGYHN
jgi:hypothetical protein